MYNATDRNVSMAEDHAAVHSTPLLSAPN